MEIYQEKCSECHGKWARGSDKGPSLLHPFYKPSHHGDESFYRAALFGVRQHHWPFGNMPPVEGMTRKSMEPVVSFLRWWQKENGIR
ncbi:MAG: cytochrome c [Magnetococcales bacterium]|nr:cytochrome c [Magnetococcales bacterium]